MHLGVSCPHSRTLGVHVGSEADHGLREKRCRRFSPLPDFSIKTRPVRDGDCVVDECPSQSDALLEQPAQLVQFLRRLLMRRPLQSENMVRDWRGIAGWHEQEVQHRLQTTWRGQPGINRLSTPHFHLPLPQKRPTASVRVPAS